MMKKVKFRTLKICLPHFECGDQGSGEVWGMAGLWSGCCLCVSTSEAGLTSSGGGLEVEEVNLQPQTVCLEHTKGISLFCNIDILVKGAKLLHKGYKSEMNLSSQRVPF